MVAMVFLRSVPWLALADVDEVRADVDDVRPSGPAQPADSSPWGLRSMSDAVALALIGALVTLETTLVAAMLRMVLEMRRGAPAAIVPACQEAPHLCQSRTLHTTDS
jgi:hypothetical protein